MAQRISTKGKFYTKLPNRAGATLWAHADPVTYQIRVWTEAAPGDVVHEAVHVTQHDLRHPSNVVNRIIECGGNRRGY